VLGVGSVGQLAEIEAEEGLERDESDAIDETWREVEAEVAKESDAATGFDGRCGDGGFGVEGEETVIDGRAGEDGFGGEEEGGFARERGVDGGSGRAIGLDKPEVVVALDFVGRNQLPAKGGDGTCEGFALGVDDTVGEAGLAEEEGEGTAGVGFCGVERGFLVAVDDEALLERVPEEGAFGGDQTACDVGLAEALELVGLHHLEFLGGIASPFEDGLRLGEAEAEIGGPGGGGFLGGRGTPGGEDLTPVLDFLLATFVGETAPERFEIGDRFEESRDSRALFLGVERDVEPEVVFVGGQ
jgi:hypothetical protein